MALDECIYRKTGEIITNKWKRERKVRRFYENGRLKYTGLQIVSF